MTCETNPGWASKFSVGNEFLFMTECVLTENSLDMDRAEDKGVGQRIKCIYANVEIFDIVVGEKQICFGSHTHIGQAER